ncbi:3-beta hydroxysteroid dehydrogenase [Cohnella kolymensis]|uniref:3-beta hydroxysteroid dehydrogenase n=1 Tax=Cohnella kolymensis TaxID=1590652 RepID=A0ABR5A891_9BACL|nr:SDR family oxidoreductase [Cohnella kolymensis]KIL37043.1 3-beta hydroxysteroid dehydrogenase [Cohnella kolymensis]
MSRCYFFTGFPGFIASSLIRQIIRDHHAAIGHIYLLVLPDLLEKAREEVQRVSAEEGLPFERFSLISGDITKPDLDILPERNGLLQHEVTHVFHLAAVYDLAVPRQIAFNVNVNGTRNVNDWVQGLHNIERYVYFSTAYVSGTREGRILESELDRDQSFKNHYESTKFEAEMLVRQVMGKVPTTIIRPGIVKGNSQTGETIKFDGPYFILNVFDKVRFLPLIPYLGAGEAEGNFVPVDYVLSATIYLGHANAGIGKTYHLTDPKPYRMKDVYRFLLAEYLGKEPIGTIPLAAAKGFLSIPALRKWLRIEKESLDYLACMAAYDCTQAQNDLRGSGIVCPDFKDTVGSMVQFYERHKNDTNKQLRIS